MKIYLPTISLRLKMVFEATHRAYTTTTKLCNNNKSTIFKKEDVEKTTRNTSTDIEQSFNNAIKALNLLQSNSATIQKAIAIPHNSNSTNIKDALKYLLRSGISLDELDKLSVIHVSGTKGKGSTCALTESILRSFGVKTGFFSSPHLIKITERIQINGRPISNETFAQYFWKVYNVLDQEKESAEDMPAYFKFLTILSFHIFLAEQVDVAIVEVGIGGEYDCTNILRNVKTVGITSLGLEHTQLLGNSLAEIAWQKSGIIKPFSNVFSNRQPDECEKVIEERALEKSSKLYWVPGKFDAYNWKTQNQPNLFENPVQQQNASLAIQLSYDWLRKNAKKVKNKEFLSILNESKQISSEISAEVVEGLKAFNWPGRFQIIKHNNIRLFIDGAHTIESLQNCIKWFKQQIKTNSSKTTYLLYNVTGDRDSEQMLQLLNSNFNFKMALFSPNIAYQNVEFQETTNLRALSTDQAINKCLNHSIVWDRLQLSNHTNIIQNKNNTFSMTFECIDDVFNYINLNESNEEVNLLVTGSLHLIGAVMNVLKFDDTK